ncbi:acyl-CoA reductase [Flavobacterium croceum]|uniref:acyl-CoA reductase n=1 Tax=Flavobacterium croceum TaxID=370975 RepID=UPI0024A892A5|nr:acyl-CoA reductase [Flavobacterium croceum]
MLQNDKKNAFVELGKFLSLFSHTTQTDKSSVLYSDLFFDRMQFLIENAVSYNGWFTQEQVIYALSSWAESLTENNLNKWLAEYQFSTKEPKNVGLVLAGNIPMVGFHDFLCVLISGNTALVKTSSNDQHLIKLCADYLITVFPPFAHNIVFIENKLENFDAVIATGSNNTARYFEYYFQNKPNIIRKNRNSVAVLNGKETQEDLENLGEDIFRYFGLGCRNVSKLFVPKNYNFDAFFNAIYKYKDCIEYQKYANNYDYNKAVFLMSLYKLLDNGFLTLKEDSSYSSPISSVFYEYYEDISEVQTKLEQEKEQIQCIVSNNLVKNSIAFGTTQKPNLWDYADNIDTLHFLLKL